MSHTQFDDQYLRRSLAQDSMNLGNIPLWLNRALDLYAEHNIPKDAIALRGQFASNRRFLMHIARQLHAGVLDAKTARLMEETFARACARDDSDPVLALEKIYLADFDSRQPGRHYAQQRAGAVA